MRVQALTDFDAVRFKLLVQKDPRAAGGTPLPFSRQGGMPEGFLEPGAEPPVGMAAEGGWVEGLQLLGGGHVVKVNPTSETRRVF